MEFKKTEIILSDRKIHLLSKIETVFNIINYYRDLEKKKKHDGLMLNIEDQRESRYNYLEIIHDPKGKLSLKQKVLSTNLKTNTSVGLSVKSNSDNNQYKVILDLFSRDKEGAQVIAILALSIATSTPTDEVVNQNKKNKKLFGSELFLSDPKNYLFKILKSHKI